MVAWGKKRLAVSDYLSFVFADHLALLYHLYFEPYVYEKSRLTGEGFVILCTYGDFVPVDR